MYHVMILGSDYEEYGSIVALHFESEQPIKNEVVKQTIRRIESLVGENVQFSIHKLATEEEGWEAVCKKDEYFSNIIELPYSKDNELAFASMLAQNKDITAKDIALFILSMCSCTQLKLQKLLYLCYADYYTKYKKKLFKEPIFAYKLGPVVKPILERYKDFREEEICDPEKEKVIILAEKEIPVIIARLALDADGLSILESCMRTVAKYGKMTASKLVTLTHTKGGPWARTYKEGIRNLIISDELIYKYHSAEEPIR